MSTSEPPVYGGRALPNGVMMVGPGRVAIAVRRPDGTIATESAAVSLPLAGLRRIPFVRGPIAVAGAIVLFVTSSKLERKIAGARAERIKQMVRMAAPVIVLSSLDRTLRSAIAGRKRSEGGAVRPGLLTMFLPLISFRMLGFTSGGRTLLQYHAAEHMAVNAAETGNELTVPLAAQQSRIHPRCGTSFTVWVTLLTWLTRRKKRGSVASVFLLVATVATAFELLYFGARNRNTPWVQKVFGPTWQAQRLTTLPPDTEHLEVAVAALSAVLSVPSATADGVQDIV